MELVLLLEAPGTDFGAPAALPNGGEAEAESSQSVTVSVIIVVGSATECDAVLSTVAATPFSLSTAVRLAYTTL